MKAASEIHEWEFGWLGKHTGKSSTERDSALPGTLSLQLPLTARGAGSACKGGGALLGHVSIAQAGAWVSGGWKGYMCVPEDAASPAAARVTLRGSV